MKVIKILIILFVVPTAFSCDNYDDNNLATKIEGEWLRSDFNSDFKYKLIFNSNQTAVRTERIGNMSSNAISNAVMFQWEIDSGILKPTDFDDFDSSQISFNANNQLVLEAFPNLFFTKVKKN